MSVSSSINQRNPVLLIHGISDTVAKFNAMKRHLNQLGWEVHSINLTPNTGWIGLDILAKQIAEYIETTFMSSQSIDLIGFSMGGLVTRYYLQRLGGIHRVQRYISISAPNYGTWMAYGLPLPGIIQMRPHSEFLQDLNDHSVNLLEKINFTTIWTPYDLMILPPQSSRMCVGQEIIVPVLVHAWMVTDTRVLKVVADLLLEPVKSY
ncbi:lipase class 2 [Gloeothece citriformis PCC 7424]|uniref:Lipase class 2 n=1 Tax=Gloeothece citriformis (strain PCC 7424) TaxID=65393 RepID=B7K7U3_GLOC7|nr:alpha/beta fold hydrolase [Gloeothece citriformis]ACK71139.1 lipase class 2 [Gloeothece citriformis PCC 7424]